MKPLLADSPPSLLKFTAQQISLLALHTFPSHCFSASLSYHTQESIKTPTFIPTERVGCNQKDIFKYSIFTDGTLDENINQVISVLILVLDYKLYILPYHWFYFICNLTYSQWTSSLPSCLLSLRIFPSLPGSRLTIFYRDASSALLQLVNQWLNFPYSRSHAFHYERKNTNSTLVRI